MDADGSHAPEELPNLLDALGNADAVLGSRWVPGGQVVNWPLSRHLISRGGNLYTRLALRMPFKDATGGYRAYRMKRAGLDGPRRGRLAGLLLPGRPGLARATGRATASSRCRSPSPSASAGPAR